jgi:hypothetical protein
MAAAGCGAEKLGRAPQAGGRRHLGAGILGRRDGKVLRETDYDAEPFQAPEWRAQRVERM